MSHLHPDSGDVVIQQRHGNPHVVYLLGTLQSPGQFVVDTRERAVALATAFATRHRVRAWLDQGDGTYQLVGSFRNDKGKPAATSSGRIAADS